MELDEIKAKATALSPWMHIATVGANGKPDVVPVHPCWEGDVLWTMAGTTSVKARNIAANPNVALHSQVTEKGDGVEIWGTATIHADLETKRRLWTGVFDYDLNAFAPGGPDDSEGTCFIAIVPERALYLDTYGMGGSFRWSADGAES
jgi:general stress protein 26